VLIQQLAKAKTRIAVLEAELAKLRTRGMFGADEGRNSVRQNQSRSSPPNDDAATTPQKRGIARNCCPGKS
jgi:hypothetical protein